MTQVGVTPAALARMSDSLEEHCRFVGLVYFKELTGTRRRRPPWGWLGLRESYKYYREVELDSPSYKRQAVEWKRDGGRVGNKRLILFPCLDSRWPPITALVVYEVAQGGAPLLRFSVQNSRLGCLASIRDGDDVRYEPGTIEFALT